MTATKARPAGSVSAVSASAAATAVAAGSGSARSRQAIACSRVPGSRDLVSQVETTAETKIEQYRGETGDIGPISTDRLHTRLDFEDLQRRGGRLHARFAGRLTGEYNASVVDSDLSGDGLIDRTAPVEVTVDFTMTTSWALTSNPGPPRSSGSGSPGNS